MLQSPLTPPDAMAPLAALEDLLTADEHARSAAHADRLRHVRAFVVENERHGFALATAPSLALALNCSEHRAWDLVEQAELLDRLPGGLDVLAGGLFTEEHARLLATTLGRLDSPEAERVWLRLVPLVEGLRARGAAYPPKRLESIVAALVLEICPPAPGDGTTPDRGDVTYDHVDDGSVDIHVLGLSAPTAQAALSRIADGAQPAGPWDTRTAGQRRRDAAADLLLGRAPLPVPADHEADPRPDGTRCGCAPGSLAVCGADVAVLVPLATAAGLSSVPAQLAGHGPLAPDALAGLLSSAPRLRPVFVDGGGVPVAVGEAVEVPARNDPADLLRALVRLATGPPGERFPVHPLDHAPGAGPPGAAHLAEPGSYSIRPHLRRLLGVRTLRCEWPGCGARAARCDLDHDDAWPKGATCSCNLGALCRRHHRVKQLGWTKTRLADGGVVWRSPSGRAHLSPPQLPPVPADLRAEPAAPDDRPDLSPQALHEEAMRADPAHPDWDRVDTTPLWAVSSPEHDPQAGSDRAGDALRHGDTAWTLDLADPYRWLPPGAWADGEPQAG